MQPMAAAVLPPCHSQGRLSTGIGAAKSVIELSRTNNLVENSPSELPLSLSCVQAHPASQQ